MAASKANPVTSIALTIGVIVVVYLGYRYLSTHRNAQGNPYIGGGSDGGYSPYQTGNAMSSAGGNWLSNLLKALLGGGGKGGQNGAPKSSGGNSGAAARSAVSPNSAQLSADGTAIADSIFGSLFDPNPDLGGYSLSTYSPDLATQSGLGDYQIYDYQPTNLQLDVPGQTFTDPSTGSYQDYVDNSSSGYADTTSYYGDFTIDG